MEKMILFPFDTEEERNRKIGKIEDMIGKDNINRDHLELTRVPAIAIKCSKKQWKKIKFLCGVNKAYW